MTKGERTKKMILETSMRLFSERGYLGVVMLDINGATGLSAGGLYRHFKSTKEIMLCLLGWDKEMEPADNPLPDMKTSTQEEFFDYCIASNKDMMTGWRKGWPIAFFEFFFTEKEYQKELDARRNEAILMNVEMLLMNESNATLSREKLTQMAKFSMYFLNGLTVSAAISDLGDQEIDEQIGLLKGFLGIGEVK